MKFLSRVIIIATSLFSGSSAMASTLSTFDLTNLESGTTNSIHMEQAGVKLDIGAYKSNDPQNSVSPTWEKVTDPYGIDVNSYGLGVKSHPGDNTDLDGMTQLESLLFTFTPTIELVSITFEHFYNSQWRIAKYFLNDDFNLTIDGELKLRDEAQNSSYFSAITFSINETGNNFRIWADHFSDDFRVSALEIATTPLPAGLWLFATAILGLVGLRRCTIFQLKD